MREMSVQLRILEYESKIVNQTMLYLKITAFGLQLIGITPFKNDLLSDVLPFASHSATSVLSRHAYLHSDRALQGKTAPPARSASTSGC